ncbi:MAG: PepSY domain-containing protein [Defluviitaleaceae bacterium]|nr:PepSY domain-containing protein [Defluviitaleaceae bacterium]
MRLNKISMLVVTLAFFLVIVTGCDYRLDVSSMPDNLSDHITNINLGTNNTTGDVVDIVELGTIAFLHLIDYIDISQPSIDLSQRQLIDGRWVYEIIKGGNGHFARVSVDIETRAVIRYDYESPISNQQPIPIEHPPVSFEFAKEIAMKHIEIVPPYTISFQAPTAISPYWRLHVNNYIFYFHATTGELTHYNGNHVAEQSERNALTRRGVLSELLDWIDLIEISDTPISSWRALSIAVSNTIGFDGRPHINHTNLISRGNYQIWSISILALDTGIYYEVSVDANTGEIV